MTSPSSGTSNKFATTLSILVGDDVGIDVGDDVGGAVGDAVGDAVALVDSEDGCDVVGTALGV